LHGCRRLRIVLVAIVDQCLPLTDDPNHILEPITQHGGADFCAAIEGLRHESFRRIGLAIVGLAQVSDMSMLYAVAGDLRPLLGQRLATPVRINVDA